MLRAEGGAQVHQMQPCAAQGRAASSGSAAAAQGSLRVSCFLRGQMRRFERIERGQEIQRRKRGQDQREEKKMKGNREPPSSCVIITPSHDKCNTELCCIAV